jgi:predicted GNAT family N-acyltransferase
MPPTPPAHRAKRTSPHPTCLTAARRMVQKHDMEAHQKVDAKARFGSVRIDQVSFEAARAEIQQIRTAVFVQEQNVPPHLEWDGRDPTCLHLLARPCGPTVRRPVACPPAPPARQAVDCQAPNLGADDCKAARFGAVGTIRIRLGTSAQLSTHAHKLPACVREGRIGKLERLAVLPPWRNQGIGGLLLGRACALAAAQDAQTFLLGAQVRAIPFYTRHGFAVCSTVFPDAGILHRYMVKTSS